jgi:hypothetical protein
VIIVICIGVLFVLNFIKIIEKVKIPLRYLNGIILGMNIEHIYRGETNMLTFFNRWVTVIIILIDIVEDKITIMKFENY